MTRVWIDREFVKTAGLGGKGTLPLEGTPTVVKTEPWDGKDGEIIEEDEFSLEELMGDVSGEKDELWVKEWESESVLKKFFDLKKSLWFNCL